MQKKKTKTKTKKTQKRSIYIYPRLAMSDKFNFKKVSSVSVLYSIWKD